ncbi:hypothetical protein EDD86DRAFT_269213 [Gorgonomyces haynaldii]|nr:hypothetical protein EDD86DRAFT_269213 [Gorgonomyces haynaldii]
MSLQALYVDASTKIDMYSVEVDGPDVEGEGKPRRFFATEKVPELPENMQLLHDLIPYGQKVSKDGPFLGYRIIRQKAAGEYIWIKYSEAHSQMLNAGAGLSHLGLKKGDCLGIYGINSPNWIIAEYASFMYGFVVVPLYETFGASAIEFIANLTESKIIFVTADKAKVLFDNVDKLPHLHTIVILDEANEKTYEMAEASSVKMVEMNTLQEMGIMNPLSPPTTIDKDDLAFLCFTSGTTGMPKGAMLTHCNILSTLRASLNVQNSGYSVSVSPNDIHISYLPLAHIFEQYLQIAMMVAGARIGFAQGDPKKLLSDVQELKPTMFVAVPRIFNRIYDRIHAAINEKGFIIRMLFKRALKTKAAYMRRGYFTHRFWDRIFFDKIKVLLGGQVRMLFSGAAPLASEIARTLMSCFSCPMIDGYGQSEGSALGTCALSCDRDQGHVGPPCPGVHMKLVDVPELKYSSKDKPYPRGEIYIKGSNVFKGYYKDPEKTAECLKPDGWFATGDIGSWDDKGRLRLLDRARNIFKLSIGEFVAPEKCESILCKHILVAQSLVYANAYQSYVVALIVPDWEVVSGWGKQKGYKHTSLSEYCGDQKFKKHLLSMLAVYCKESELNGFEVPKNILLLPEPFSVENNMLTPTLKLRRQEVVAKYKDKLEALYKD